MPPQSPSESGDESEAHDIKHQETDNSDNEDEDSEDEAMPSPVPLGEHTVQHKRKVPLPESTKKSAPEKKKKSAPRQMSESDSDGGHHEPVRYMTSNHPKVVEEPIDAVADAEQARQQVASAPASAPAAATVTESYVDPSILNDVTFVQVSANGLMAAVVPNQDIVHAVGISDPIHGVEDGKLMKPFEITKDVTKGIASSKLATQKSMLEENMTRVLRSVIIIKVKSKDPALKQQNIQFCVPVTITEGDTISKAIDDQINTKAPEGHCKLWPLEPKIVMDLYKQTRNKLPSKFMPNDTIKAVVIKNVESQAEIDSNWTIVAKSTSRASSSGTKRAATAGEKPSKKLVAAESSPPPKKSKPSAGLQTPSVHAMIMGASANEPTTNGSVESSSFKIDLDTLSPMHPDMMNTRVAMFEMSSTAEVSIVRVDGKKVLVAFSK